jgi:hypothetical protein
MELSYMLGFSKTLEEHIQYIIVFSVTFGLVKAESILATFIHVKYCLAV